MPRKKKAVLYERCDWIAEPNYYRCPRPKRTGIDCPCSFNTPRGWPWRSIPPVWDPASGKQPYIINEDGIFVAPKAEADDKN